MKPGQPEWLFRQGELVLGPLTADQLIQKLFAGEIDARTPVQKMGDGGFRRLGEVDAFRVHVAKSEAKARVDKSAMNQAVAQKKTRNVKIIVTVAIATVIASVVGGVGYRLAVDSPWKDVDEEAFGDITISIEPGSIKLAKANIDDEELVDYPLPKDGKKSPTTLAQNTKKSPASDDKPEGTKLAKAQTPKSNANKVNNEADEPDGMQMAKFDQGAINGVVAAKQKTLYPCLIAEAQKNPGLSAKIPIEFVIGNDGRVAKVWVDHPSFKSGTLPECLLQKLQAWQFKAYDGERATVSLSFKIGKSG